MRNVTQHQLKAERVQEPEAMFEAPTPNTALKA